ncbi:hypothetical protein BDV96DRAFT_595324 [Lophiotrema nucula]|uniref:DUF6604 domain-containing protein n=1 Tax=Lophiotrema nucula TaxID=690887 RepID=A0A6A5ZNW7_9PLEO|nr:hypothetical protein BDV96DRAFT_595324 [Lophiotrema nucula]
MDLPFRFDALPSSYRQYKEDTEYVAGWLAEKSAQIGYKLKAPQGHPESSKRLKGKARKIARETTNLRSGVLITPKYIINRSDFVPMAKLIAKQLKPSRIPGSLNVIFNRAIEKRRKVSELFHSSPDGNASVNASNRRHLHFIGILEEAFESLWPFSKVDHWKTRAHSITTPAPKLNPLCIHNKFAHLKVEDSDSIAESPGGHKSQDSNEGTDRLPRVASVVIELDESDIEEEFLFAIQSFMEEFEAIRMFLGDVWSRYKESGFNLTIASLLTNTAIDIVRHAESQFDLSTRRPARYPASTFPVWSLPALLFCESHDSMDEGTVPSMVLPGPGIPVPAGGSACTHSDFCLWSPYQALKWYMFSIKQGGIKSRNAILPVARDLFDGRLDESAWRTLETIQVLRTATQMSASTFALDEITRGIRHMFKYSEVPIWVTLGMQLFLDIQDVLGETLEEPYRDLQSHVSHEVRNYADSKYRRSSMKLRQGETTILNRLDTILDDIQDWALDDFFGQLLAKPPPCHFPGALSDMQVERDYLLKRHPVRCGLLKYDLYFQLQDSGANLDVQTLRIFSLAHLYTAGKILYPDSPTWPDMELLLQRQDPEWIFHGELPKTLDEAARKFVLGLGASANNFARNRRNDDLVINRKKVRSLRNPSILSELYLERMNTEPDTPETSASLVSRLMQKICDPSSKKLLARQDNLPSSATEAMKTKEEKKAPAVWDPMELLLELEGWLLSDPIDLHFDWLYMQSLCAKILAQISAELGEQLIADSPLAIAGAVLDSAARNERLVLRSGISIPSIEIAPELCRVWEIIQANVSVETNQPGQRKTWVGDHCVTRLMSINSESARFFATLGPASGPHLYNNWDWKGSLTYRRMAVFSQCVRAARKMAEMPCEDCGEVHGNDRADIHAYTGKYLVHSIQKLHPEDAKV